MGRDAFFLKHLYYLSSLITISERYISCGERSFLQFNLLNSLFLGPTNLNHHKLILYRDLEHFSDFLKNDVESRSILISTKEKAYIPTLGSPHGFNDFKDSFSLAIKHSLFSRLPADLEMTFMSNLSLNTIISKERR